MKKSALNCMREKKDRSIFSKLIIVGFTLAVMFFISAVQQAQAADQTITGSAVDGNLAVTVRDTGSMNVQRYTSGSWQNQIFAGSSKGSMLYINGASCGLGYFGGTAAANTGNSTSGNTITTDWTCTNGASVRQETTYISGNAYIAYRWTITNTSGSSLSDLRFFHGEDTYLLGGDNGAGFWDGATNTIGVQKQDPPSSGNWQKMSLQGVTAPFNYQSERYADVYNSGGGGALNGTIDSNEATDNGYALEWRQGSLGAGVTWTINAYEKFGNVTAGGLVVNPPVAADIYAGSSTSIIFSVDNTTGSSDSVALSVSVDQAGWTASITSPSSPTTIAAGGSASVSVNVTAPAGAPVGTTCRVTLTATGATSASDFSSVTVQTPPSYTVSTTITGSGSATPASQSVLSGNTASITFNAGTGYHITSISGCGGTAYTPTYTVGTTGVTTNNYTTGAVTADCTVSATFALNQYTVTATAVGTGSGTVTSNTGGISYSYHATETGTSAPINHFTTVVLTASAAAGSTVAWTTCSGTTAGNGTATATCTYTSLDGNKAAEATFILTSNWTINGSTKEACVDDSDQLQDSLDDSEADGYHNLIKVVQGDYVGLFAYEGIENFDLTLEAGYDAGCVTRTFDPALTVLDGDTDVVPDDIGNGIVLDLTGFGSGDLKVDGFSITNGVNAVDYGGCLRSYTDSGQTTITGNVVSYCTAAVSGGGIGAETNSGKLLLTNNVVHHNGAVISGGGIDAFTVNGSLVILNNTVADNDVSNVLIGSGGGLAVLINSEAGSADIVNNIIRGNTVHVATLHLCEDVSINSDGNGNSAHAVVAFHHNDSNTVNGVCSNNPLFTLGTGNLNINPLFLGISTQRIFQNYHLQNTSACKDRGYSSHADLPSIDIDGQSRVQYSVVDMGADEVKAYVAAPGRLIVPLTSEGSVRLTASTSATPRVNYIFEYRKTTDLTWTTYNSGTVNSPTIYGLTAGIYEFRVYVTAGGYDNSPLTYGDNTCTVLMTVGMPSFLTVPASSGDGTISLVWGTSSTVGVTYVVEESNSAAFTTVTEVYRGSATSTTLIGRTIKTYYYRVKAIKTGLMDSGWRNGSNACVVSNSISMPVSLTVPSSSNNGTIGLSWGASSTAGVTYVVEESTSPTFSTITEVYRGVAFSTTLTGRATGTYYYRLKAVKTGLADSGWRNGSNACVVTSSVGIPVFLTVPASSGNGTIGLSWGASSTVGVTYVVEESASPTYSSVTEIYRGPLTTTALANRAVGIYYYRVKAIRIGLTDSGWRNGSNACVVSVAIGAPVFMTVPASSGNGTIGLSWGASSTSGVTYVVQESTSSTYSSVTEVYRGIMISTTLAGRTGGTYYYRVKAIKTGSADSSWRNGSNACIVTVPVSAPSFITVPPSSSNGIISLSWGASSTSGASYVVEESVSSGFSKSSRVYSGPLRSVTLGGKAKNTTYYYRVKAVKTGASDSGWRTGLNGCIVR